METSEAKGKIGGDIVLTDKNGRKEIILYQRGNDLNTNIIAEKSENSPDKNGLKAKTDKLEKYLENIYQKYCKISIGESEIEFIRNGIEQLVSEYVKKTYSPTHPRDNVHYFSDIELLKVGSFYEGTRNGFPDEFDFIAVLGTIDEAPDKDTDTFWRKNLYTQRDVHVYQSEHLPNASISFCFTDDVKFVWKTETLEYLYRNGREEIPIAVDIVTALRCFNTEKFVTENGIFSKDFYQEILKTGSVLFIFTGFSSSLGKTGQPEWSDVISRHDYWDKTITETEKRFVRDILSKKHRKVYQILKYIINGHFGEDLFKHLQRVEQFPSITDSSFCISSYTIKVAVIHHHYNCDNNSGEVGDCVLKILRYFLLAYEQSGRGVYFNHWLYPSKIGPFLGSGTYSFLGNFYWCLRAFIDRLASLKAIDGFEKCTHDLENSYMEMVLRLDIFDGYVYYLSYLNDFYSDSSIITRTMPNFGRLAQKVKHYNEKRSKISNCPWCDYPIFVMAHKRNV